MTYTQRLMLCESMWEAHAHRAGDAVRVLSACFKISQHAGMHNTLVGYLVAKALDASTLAGFKRLLLMYSRDPAVCRAVQTAIAMNWHPKPLSSTLKVEAAIQQGYVDDFLAQGPSALGHETVLPSAVGFRSTIDAYGAFELHEMRRCIAAADEPNTQSAPVLQSIGREATAKYPESGTLPNFIFDYSNTTFNRDAVMDQSNIVRVAAAVLIYHAAHGKYPASLAAAVPSLPVDAFDGKPLHYVVTAAGFVLSAPHLLKGARSAVPYFSYPR